MAQTPDFTVVDNPSESRFEARLPDGSTAVVVYKLLSSGLLIDHTEVPQQWEGKGVAGKIARDVLADVRARGLMVLPVCPFFSGWIANHPEAHDLVHPHYRAALGI